MLYPEWRIGRGYEDRWPQIRVEKPPELLEKMGVWIGPPVHFAESRIVKPLKYTPVEVDVKWDHLPPWLKGAPVTLREILPGVPFAVRSRAAQTGVHCTFSFVEGNKAKIDIAVYGGRPLKIKEGQEIGCFFYPCKERLITGKNLVDSIGNELSIDGEYRKDWVLVDEEGRIISIDEDTATGIGLRLKEERYYPEKGEPINILGNVPGGIGYREYLDNYVLVKIPKGERRGFWVTETRAGLYLPFNHTGLLNPGVYRTFGEMKMIKDDRYRHVGSPVLKGGETNWPIRAEIINGEGEFYGNMWVIMRLYSGKDVSF